MHIASIILIVLSNVVYNISQKSTPGRVNPFAALLVTYTVAAILTLGASLCIKTEKGLLSSFSELNWTSVALGCAIVGLEMGYLFAYRTGWHISVATVVANICLAILLVPVGYLMYGEAFHWHKIAGIILCLAGLSIITMK
jgi:drug/metabolite transporter (DMT)-like permease